MFVVADALNTCRITPCDCDADADAVGNKDIVVGWFVGFFSMSEQSNHKKSHCAVCLNRKINEAIVLRCVTVENHCTRVKEGLCLSESIFVVLSLVVHVLN